MWRAPGGASPGVRACDYAGVAEREAAQPCKRGATGAAPHQRKDSIMKIGARNQIKGTSRPSRKAARPSPSSRRPTSWSLSTSDSSARARCARRLESLKPLWVGALLLLGDFCLFIWDSHSLWSPCPATRVLPPRQTRTLKLRRIRESRALRRRLGRWPPWLC